MNEFNKSEILEILTFKEQENNSDCLYVSTNNYRLKIIKKLKTLVSIYITNLENKINIFYLAVSYFDKINAKKPLNLLSEDNQNLVAKCCLILAIKFTGNFDYNLKHIIMDIIHSINYYYNTFEINCLNILEHELSNITPYDILLGILHLAQNEQNDFAFPYKIFIKIYNHSKSVLYRFVENNYYSNYSPKIIAISIIKYTLENLGIYNIFLNKFINNCFSNCYNNNKVNEIIRILDGKEVKENNSIFILNNKCNYNDYNNKSPSTGSSSPSEPFEKSPNYTSNNAFHLFKINEKDKKENLCNNRDPHSNISLPNEKFLSSKLNFNIKLDSIENDNKNNPKDYISDFANINLTYRKSVGNMKTISNFEVINNNESLTDRNFTNKNFINNRKVQFKINKFDKKDRVLKIYSQKYKNTSYPTNENYTEYTNIDDDNNNNNNNNNSNNNSNNSNNNDTNNYNYTDNKLDKKNAEPLDEENINNLNSFTSRRKLCQNKNLFCMNKTEFIDKNNCNKKCVTLQNNRKKDIHNAFHNINCKENIISIDLNQMSKISLEKLEKFSHGFNSKK